MKCQHSPIVSGDKATFLWQRHPDLLNYFPPISFNKGSLFIQNGWVSPSSFCTRETGGSWLLWMRYVKSWRLICQAGQGLDGTSVGQRCCQLRSHQQSETSILSKTQLMLPSATGSFYRMQNQGLKWSMEFHLHRTFADSSHLRFLLKGSCCWVRVRCHINTSVSSANIVMVTFFNLPQKS